MSDEYDDAMVPVALEHQLQSNLVLGLEAIEREVAPQAERYLERRALGDPRYVAGAAVGLSPRDVDAMLEDATIADMDARADDLLVDGIEKIIIEKARGGNQRCLEMVLKALRPDKWGERQAMNPAVPQVNIGEINYAVTSEMLSRLRDMDPARRQSTIAGAQQAAIEAAAIPVDGDDGSAEHVQ